MGKRTNFEDIANMALLYINRATGSNMILYDNVIWLQLIDGILVKRTNSSLTIDEVVQKILEEPKDFFILLNKC